MNELRRAAISSPASTTVTIKAPCTNADFNGDGVVNSTDLAAMLGMWGTNGIADINGDGMVNASDLAILLSNWGVCP